MCATLGIPEDFDLLKEVLDYIFYDKRPSSGGGDQTMDFVQHYDIIWATFKMQGIDLNKDTINWWEFSALLESFMLLENLPLTKMVSKLSEKPPKADNNNADYISGLANFKRRYGIKNDANKGLGNLFNSLKGIADNK